MPFKQTCPNGHEFVSRVEHPVKCVRSCRMERKGDVNQATTGESHEIKDNTWAISLPKTRIHTLPELLKFCEVDTEIWAVDRFIVNKYEFGAKDAAQQLHIEPLFQVKAWLKKKQAVAFAKKEIESLIHKAKKFTPKYPRIVREKLTTGNLLEVNLTDHHFGKLAWSKETGGWGDYDLNIANKCWDLGTDALISRVGASRFDSCVLVIGNDLLHVDNSAGTTTRGTPVTTDSRFQKIYPVVRDAIIRTVDKLLRLAPVRVMVMPGNHDANASFAIGDSIYCWYHNCKEVEVDNTPAPRKYLQWGHVMLMWSHGNEGKLRDYPEIMAVEAPQMWGATRVREVHTGDKHQRRLEEFHGVAVRILPTLCPPDEWHSKKGFVGNVRSSEAFVWNKKQGLIATATYTDPGQFKK